MKARLKPKSGKKPSAKAKVKKKLNKLIYPKGIKKGYYA